MVNARNFVRVQDVFGAVLAEAAVRRETRIADQRRERYVANQRAAERAAEQADLASIAQMMGIDLAEAESFRIAQDMLGMFRAAVQATALEVGANLHDPVQHQTVRDLVAHRVDPKVVAAKYGADLTNPDDRAVVEALAALG